MNTPRNALLSFALLLTACGAGSGVSEDFVQSEVQFVEGVKHPYFPLEHGTLRIYDGVSDNQQRREEVRTLPDLHEIDGVMCTAVEQQVYLDGELSEVTTEWYAQDANGSVWKFGEQSFEAEGGVLRPDATDSWVAGHGDAKAWVAFANDPSAGDEFTGYTGSGPELYRVTSISQTVAVPAGTFANCMEMAEDVTEETEDGADIILYARGVGRVRETNADTAIDLIQVEK